MGLLSVRPLTDNGQPPADLLRRLSPTHAALLKKLWPGAWVPTTDLVKITGGQSDTPRRIRELRKEVGFTHLRSTQKNGVWGYQLVTRERASDKERRAYLSPVEKEQIIQRDGLRCNICHLVPPEGQVNGYLQFDHREPFDKRLGETSVANSQLLCIDCNLVKRKACERCTLDTCEGCPYAYPEKVAHRHVVAFPGDTGRAIEAEAKRLGLPADEIVRRLVAAALSRKS